ncbi:PAS domain-containing sensor histidine kinase [Ideonella sp. B7]|uniref:sensor histidine kinase n=1 Tax=Ideonella benzenivorans TaxID=2831643 RepID=UPI001CEC8F24|nr:PAS domain-containing sensor histidine kinase [Ideonella benzenivorans]MCA6218197.1 PAS domain-containing sensor histidine kinase [Ideonella benzenivorans]
MSGGPATREFVWREAQAALLDQLRRNDPAHALRRATRSLALAAGREVALVGGARADDSGAGCWLGGPTASPAALQAQGWSKPLDCTGERVGTVWFATGPAGDDRGALLDLLAPLLETTAELLALWLEARGQRSPASLSLVQVAMREAGTYVWEWDLRTDVLSDIDEGALMLGYDPDALGHTQADWDRLIHPDDAAGAEAAYQAHARGETPLYQTRYRARAADGRWRWIEERGRVVERDADLNPVRMLGTQTDATLQHALEEARRERAVAQAANAAKTQFLSRVSHELRTPLHAVLSFARLMASDPDHPLPPAQQRRLTHVQQAGEHLQALIDDLLDLSLVEAGRLHLQPEAVVLADLLAEVQALIQPQAEAAGIVLDVPPVPPGAMVRADARRLRQVLLNLVSNAIKYNRPQGRVRLSAQASAAGWTLAVADTGSGIAPERLSELFQPFSRLGREHGPVGGVGLGLALSQMLVQAMGGEIRVDSVLAGPDGRGGGTTFRVMLAAA